jgi:outer membrane lipoprotein-sorting protein
VKYRWIALAAIIAFGLAGCTSTRTVAVGTASVSFEDAVERADNAYDRLQSLTADGTIRIETPSLSQSGDFELALRKPDTVQITVEGPFGIRVAQAMITRTSFQAYSALENKLYVAATTPENLQKALKIDLSFDDILALFTGGRVLEADRRTPDASGADGGDAYFLFKDGDRSRRYVVDPTTLALRKIQILDRQGIMTFEQAFSDQVAMGDITLPKTARATLPQKRQVITLRYDGFRPNPGDLRFSFSPPGNARRIELQ